MSTKMRVLALAGIVIVCLVVILASNTGTESAYSRCVTKCENQARDHNIDRTDITDAEFRHLMDEYRSYICPGRCE